MTDDLITWLRAQLDEDEARISETEWTSISMDPLAARRRALAEIDAKRRILDRYEDALARQGDWQESQTAADICATEYEDWVLPQLAAPYAGRDGYQDRWKP